MPCAKETIKILFVYSALSSFIRTDLEILQKHFNVKTVKIEVFFVPRKGRNPLEFLRLLKGILLADIAFTWFADVNAFFMVLFCKFLRKKSVIVVGGYDVVYIPEIDYGILRSSFGRVRARFIFEHATRILPFSYHAKDMVLGITKKVNFRVIQLSCDVKKLKPFHVKKENLAITVCYIDKDNVVRKGLKTFVESAKSLPQTKFALIGSHEDDAVNYLKKTSAPNVEFTGYVSNEVLHRWYQKAKVYCQLSYEEGFGVALIEAMACGCVPVVSLKARALRETVGKHGFYVPYGDVEATVKAIKEALSAPREMGLTAKERVENLFAVERREKELLRAINDILYSRK